jgi:photosystem II stability/assembly factor-like uncharacterized protein
VLRGISVVLGLVLSSPLLSQNAGEPVAFRLFAATSAGPFLSTNWGEDFVPMEPELPASIRTFSCLGPWVFAGGAEGLFLSLDFGETWTPVESWNGGEVVSIVPSSYFVVDPVVFVGAAEGLYRSQDGGRRWRRLAENLLEGTVRGLAWPGPSLFAATSRGLYRSDDNGERWSTLSVGLPDTPLLSIALSRYFGQDPVAFVGTDGAGIYRTRDGGKTFVALGEPEWAERTVPCLFWWGVALYAGTDTGLFLSRDAGESWESAAAELEGLRVNTILVPAAESTSGSDILVGTERGVFKSSDGSVTWHHLKDLRDTEVFGFGSFPVPPEPVSDQKRR